MVRTLARISILHREPQRGTQITNDLAVRNWVFLGDSLTEGVGSKRISHVTELVNQLRNAGSDFNVHEFRLRYVDSQTINPDIDFNVAGLINGEERVRPADLWVWNLACEGQMIDSDFGWLPLIGALRPELVVIFRGSLESIIRPAMLLDLDWPWWVPQSWRGYAAMDPRCYFSTTWWRRAKQSSIDSLKQKLRLKLLKIRPGGPLIDLDLLGRRLSDLIKRLRALGTRVLILGLLPLDDARFPGSPQYFKSVNARLEEIATAEGAEFFDWGSRLPADGDLFYRDSFHPNKAGASALANILRERLEQ
ncbi:MAG TPA: SGNH/GDSL hydrolase family protein [Pyrinomonadaceae bacterium]|nr:SGNH/GDSL hydrolase family protein [Pyrinomonadaceae bacterium]